MADRIAVTVLTGFLGSGKTTLLNRLLRDPSLADTAVLVNELGDVGLDHYLIERADENIVLLDAGCLCCTINTSLRETLADLQMRRTRGEVPRFARVVIETTGLAHPGPILAVLTTDRLLLDHYRLDSLVTCVDVLHADAQLDRQPEAVNQIAMAEKVVLTKVDAADPARIAAVAARVRTINPGAAQLRAAHGAVPPAALFGAPGAADPAWLQAVRDRIDHRDDHDGHGHGHGPDDPHPAERDPHDHGIAALSLMVPPPVTWAGIAAWCSLMAETHGAALLRVKAILRIADGGPAVALHGVGRDFAAPVRLARWPWGDDETGRLVVIARGLDAAAVTGTLDLFQLPPGSQRPASFAAWRAAMAPPGAPAGTP